MYVKFTNGEIKSYIIPSVGELPNGVKVSNFNKLSDDILAQMDWYPFIKTAETPPTGEVVIDWIDSLENGTVFRNPIYGPPPEEPIVPPSLGELKESAFDILYDYLLKKIIADDDMTDEMAEKIHYIAEPLDLDGKEVSVGDIYSWNGTLIEVLLAHTTQSDWTPEAAPSLFKIFRNVSSPNSPDEWVRPAGAHDAYSSGAFVTYNDQVWLNTHGDGNVWAPDEYGWALYEP